MIETASGRVSIYADVSVWIGWVRTKVGDPESDTAEYEAFDALLTRLSAVGADIWYSAAVELEITRDDERAEFARAVERFKLKRGRVPLVRADGSYRFDGSALAGGQWGGAGHEIRSSAGDRDTEHFEAALEAGATWCLTLDDTWKKVTRPELRERIKRPSEGVALLELGTG